MELSDVFHSNSCGLATEMCDSRCRYHVFFGTQLLDPTSIQWAPQTWLIYLDRAWGDETVDCPMETAVAGTHMKISAPKFGVCGPSLE